CRRAVSSRSRRGNLPAEDPEGVGRVRARSARRAGIGAGVLAKGGFAGLLLPHSGGTDLQELSGVRTGPLASGLSREVEASGSAARLRSRSPQNERGLDSRG